MNAEESIVPEKRARVVKRAAKGAAPARGIASNRAIWARTAWIVTGVVTLTLYFMSVPLRYNQLVNSDPEILVTIARMGLTSSFYATYLLGLEIATAMMYLTVSAVLFWRKSSDNLAVFISLMLLLFGLCSFPVVNTMQALADSTPLWMPAVRFLTYLNWVFVFIFFTIFPDGRVVARWSVALVIIAAIVSIPWNLWPDSPLSPWMWPPVPFVTLEVSLWGGCLYAMIYKYRRFSNPVQKQQTKWAVSGLIAGVAGTLLLFLPRAVFPELTKYNETGLTYHLVSQTGMYIAVMLMPVTLGFSILRYRLWDIDLIINRTLVYVPLTGILAGFYSASIALFQRVFVAATGEKSDAAIVMSTLILASLFTPMKNALQTAVDKRFKEQPDPTKSLQSFGEQVDAVMDVVDPRTVTRRLVDEAVAAFGAAGGAVYLTQGERRGPTYRTEGWTGEAQVSVPLKVDKLQVGVLELGPRRTGASYLQKDLDMLGKVAETVTEAVMLNKRWIM